MTPTATGAVLALTVFLLAPRTIAQVDERVLGTWIGIGEDNEGQKAVVDRQWLTLDGERVPLRFGSSGVLLIGPPDAEERLTYVIRDDVLTVDDGDSATRWRRAAAKPKTEPQKEPKPAPTHPRGTLTLERRELTDPESNGIVSHTILVPKGWAFDGGVRWTQQAFSYVHFIGRMRSPDGAELSFDYNRSFAYTTDEQALAAVGQRMGGTDENGSTLRLPPKSPGEVAVQVILPQLRPGATNVQLIDAKTLPEAERRLRETNAAFVQQLEAQNRPGDGVRAAPWMHVERARVSYEEGGQEWEEEVSYSAEGAHLEFRTRFVNYDSGMWGVNNVRTARARRGQLDAVLPTLMTLAGTVREAPRWSQALFDLRARIQQIRHEGNMAILQQMARRSQIMAQTQAELSDQQMTSWRQRQEAADGMHRATINAIVGVHDYRTPDGGSIAADNGYDRVFQDKLGNVILTNDPGFDPNADSDVGGSWSQLQRIQHIGK